MNLKQMKQFEREKQGHAKHNAQQQAAQGKQVEFPDEVKRAGEVIGLTPEARAEWFKRMREVACGEGSRLTDEEKERQRKDAAQPSNNQKESQ